MGKFKRPGPKTRGQLVADKFSVGCKCHNHDAFKEYSDSDRLYKTQSRDFSIKERHYCTFVPPFFIDDSGAEFHAD